MKYSIVFFNLLFCTVALHATPKVVGLIAARNEGPIIAQCLKTWALYTDAIVFLDDASDDDTLAQVRALEDECRIERIITKTVWHRDETGDRNKLLQAGREIGGTHFFLFDADEIPSSNCLENNTLRNALLALKPGEKLVLRLIDLWRSVWYYRVDRCPYSYRILDCGFCDDGVCYYDSGFIHASHSPQHRSGGEKWMIGDQVILHFAFVNWQDVVVKYAWYQCLERIRLPEKSSDAINESYRSGTNEQGIEYRRINDTWLSGYPFFNPDVFYQGASWRTQQIKQWFEQYGKDYFAGLALVNDVLF